MDIHRCRFVQYPYNAINAVAFSHPNALNSRSEQVRLAIGRANGNIEIWNPLQGIWLQESTLYGGADRSVEGLTWTQDPEDAAEESDGAHGKTRLFSIGSSNAVTEWDLQQGLPLRQSTGTYSGIWCLAAQPRKNLSHTRDQDNVSGRTEDYHQHLAVGCEDGSIILLSTADDDLTFEKHVTHSSERKARVLSITWKNSDTIAAGFANSSIKIFKIKSGKQDSLIQSISLGGGPQGGPKERLVWAIHALPDGTIVSGDSLGECHWFDRENYGQIQKIKAHEGDILCIASSADGKTVYSGGIDRRTVIFRSNSTSKTGHQSWAKYAHTRIHRDDVKAMASLENQDLRVVVSGGPDAMPTIMAADPESNENHRRLSFVPQAPPVDSAGRLVVSWWDREVRIWRVRSRPGKNPVFNGLHSNNYTLVKCVALRGEENVTSASISPNGTLLAIATMAELKIFLLGSKDDSQHELHVSKMLIPEEIAKYGARMTKFSPDNKWLLCVNISNELLLYQLAATDSSSYSRESQHTISKLKRTRGHRANVEHPSDSWNLYKQRISLATFSNDCRLLAVSDLSGKIDVWMLGNAKGQAEDHSEDSSGMSSSSIDESSSGSDRDDGKRHCKKTLGLQWRRVSGKYPLPRLQSAAIVLSFCPDNDNSLFILTATHEVYEFLAKSGEFTPWSRRNPSILLPTSFKAHRDRAIGAVWDCSENRSNARKRIWLYSSTWLFMINMNQDLPVPAPYEHEGSSKPSSERLPPGSRKRKRDAELQEALRARGHSAGAGSRKRLDDIANASTDHVETLHVDGDHARRDYPEKVNGVVTVNGDSQNDWREIGDGQLEDGSLDLLRHRRQPTQEKSLAVNRHEINNEDSTIKSKGDDNHHSSSNARDQLIVAGENGIQEPPYYLTTKYRSILGVLPLTRMEVEEDLGAGNLAPDPQQASQEDILEVAIIERPERDLESTVGGLHEGRERRR